MTILRVGRICYLNIPATGRIIILRCFLHIHPPPMHRHTIMLHDPQASSTTSPRLLNPSTLDPGCLVSQILPLNRPKAKIANIKHLQIENTQISLESPLSLSLSLSEKSEHLDRNIKREKKKKSSYGINPPQKTKPKNIKPKRTPTLNTAIHIPRLSLSVSKT